MPRSSPSQTISRSCMEVRTKPGQTALTRMPCGAISRASAWVQPKHRELARRIVGEERRADLGGERGGVDDDAFPLLREEIAAGDLVGQEDAARIDVEVEVPILVGDVDRAPHGRDAGIGAEDVEAAEMGDARSAMARSHGCAVAHVDLKRRPAPSPISPASASAAARSTSATTTRTPARARARTMAAPIPRAPPVTRARRPLQVEGSQPCSRSPTDRYARVQIFTVCRETQRISHARLGDDVRI